VGRHHGHPGRGPGLADHRPGPGEPSSAGTAHGLWALKASCAGLLATGLLQLFVALLSGSVALLADTIHNFADAATAIPLAVAFWLGRRAASRRFPYGLGRAEDLAGVVILLVILASALLAAAQAVDRLLHPRPVDYLGAVMAASVVGFVGNEAVALYRIRVGRQIGSAALVAEGYHARVDGWTSLAVLGGTLGVWSGYPVADPLVGLAIAGAILALLWQAGREVMLRMLDGVDAATIGAVIDAAGQVPGLYEVSDVRARWVGHRLHVELSVAVPGQLTVEEGHAVASEVRHQLLHHMPHLGGVAVHVDPLGRSGERHHGIGAHAHDGLPTHTHD
jgi:cation diffusion facilitator family transporter